MKFQGLIPDTSNTEISTETLDSLALVAENFAVSVTSQLEEQIQKTQHPGIIKQFLPDPAELVRTDSESSDPIGDFVHSPVAGIVHRHPDRCLLKIIQVCPVYCRFCFRKEQLGPKKPGLTKEELEQAFRYIEMHPEIWEVILTGGDPLILKPKMLENVLKTLEKIQHVNIIRIHTRIPVLDSKRITSELIDIFKNMDKTLYLAIHANHPEEFTEESFRAIACLSEAGIPLVSQTVLLKGVNDNVETLEKLFRLFVKHKIKPYYLHHLDLAAGTSHFRVSIETGQALMRDLRKRVSGLCLPNYVLDIPGGHGKVPLNEAYLLQTLTQENHYQIYDLEGRLHDYPKS